MVDTVVNLQFNNTLFDANGNAGGSYSGNINVDYTTNKVTGSITVNYNGGVTRTYTGTDLSFSNASNIPGSATSSAQYVVFAGIGSSTNTTSGSTTTASYPDGYLLLGYNGQSPTSIGGTAALPGTTVTWTTVNGVPSGQPNITAGGFYSSTSNTSAQSLSDFMVEPVTSTTTSGTPQAACYASGTLIRTIRGEVAVEDLQIGDMVVTASGAARPIVWLGHRSVDCSSLADDPRTILPVRIRAHAFGEGAPERDLLVSPGHSICVTVMDEVLIQAAELVNGATIAQVEVDAIDYWHVELESHDVIFAEGLPAESFLDAGNRGFFDGESELPDAAAIANWAEAFRYPCVNSGPILEAVRARLAARAQTLGWTATVDPGLRLVVDGAEVEGIRSGDLAVFLFPASAREARLRSDVFSPLDLGLSSDRRSLGLRLTGLMIGDGSASRSVALDDPCLGTGFYAAEENGAWRWTDGDAVIPAELWAENSETVALQVRYETKSTRGWIAPTAAPASMQILHVAA